MYWEAIDSVYRATWEDPVGNRLHVRDELAEKHQTRLQDFYDENDRYTVYRRKRIDPEMRPLASFETEDEVQDYVEELTGEQLEL
jgi:hypothetical protein